jgi:S1-C subfamily serine protease
MKARNCILLAGFMVAAAVLQAAPGVEDAVVRIIGEGVTQDSLGTGFFISPEGKVLTCYHVIVGAKNLIVVAGGIRYKNVIVSGIAPDYDLAELLVRDLPARAPFIALTEVAPESLWQKPLAVYGNPSFKGDQYSQSFLPATTTSRTFIRSGTYRSKGDRPEQLFAKDIDVFEVVADIDNGVSGGPLMDGNRAVGVLSGSIEEGGTHAWAIPVKYLNSLQGVGKPAGQIAQWAPLGLMANKWKNLRKQARLGAELVDALDRFGDTVYAMTSAYDEAVRTRVPAAKAFIVQFQAMIDDEVNKHGPDYPLDRDAGITAYMDGFEQKLGNLEAFDAAGEAFEDASDNLNIEMSRYFKRLPQTPKNQKLEEEIRLARSKNTEKILALANNEDDRFEHWAQETYNKMGGEPNTLKDARRAAAVLNSALDDMVASFDPGIKQLFDLERTEQAIIERIWEADQ